MPNLTGVRERRRSTGVRVGAFAPLAGYKRNTMIGIENGRFPASVEGTERIASALTSLGVPTRAADLLPAVGSVPDKPPKQPAKDPKAPKRREETEKKTRPKRAADSASAA